MPFAFLVCSSVWSPAFATDGGVQAIPDPGDQAGREGSREADPRAATTESTAAPVAPSPAADGGAPPSQDTPAALSGPPPAVAQPPPDVVPPPPPPPPSPATDARDKLHRVDPITVVGTRESRTAGSAHVLRPRDLERMNYDNPETVTKQVPGVYARGEDGFGLRPNIGIRGTSPDRSKKVTLMEDGVLFAPAPYSAPAAYYFPLITRMELVRVIKGPGSVSFGPNTVGGAIDLVTRSIPPVESGGIDLSAGAFGYGKVHGYYGASTARSGYVLEGVHLRSTGYKVLDGGGDTGFEKNEWMWKGRHLLSTDPDASQEIGLKLGYADEDSRESYLGLTDADFRKTPYRRYAASRFDRMLWHRTQIAASYRARFAQAFTLDVTAYRQDFARTWNKVNRLGYTAPGTENPGSVEAFNIAIADILRRQADPENVARRGVLAGELDSAAIDGDGLIRHGTIYIGPNRRQFAAQGIQGVATWTGTSGPVSHRLEAGVRYHYDRIDRLHTEDGYRMRAGVLVRDTMPTITTANARAWAHAVALHATDAATLGPLTLTPGLRVEVIETWERDRLAGTDTRGARQTAVIPGIGAYGAIAPWLGVLAGVHRGFSPAAPGQPAAVRPESSVNYEAGIRVSPPRFRMDAIGFFNDYRNLTSICTFASGCASSQEGAQYNAGRAHIYGTELFLRADPLARGPIATPVMASYTYTRTELLETFTSQDPTLGNVQAGDELPFVPRHQASAMAAVEASPGSLALAATYVSPMREHAGQGSDPNEPQTDESLIFDVVARAKLGSAGELYLTVRNLLGAQDLAARLPFGARPVAPRWIQVGTKWSF